LKAASTKNITKILLGLPSKLPISSCWRQSLLAQLPGLLAKS
jgi:hypothetical protein